jgi:hypothetical protein
MRIQDILILNFNLHFQLLTARDQKLIVLLKIEK